MSYISGLKQVIQLAPAVERFNSSLHNQSAEVAKMISEQVKENDKMKKSRPTPAKPKSKIEDYKNKKNNQDQKPEEETEDQKTNLLDIKV